MADSRHLKNLFGHNSAADCPIAVKFYVRKRFFYGISVMGQILAFTESIFCFPDAVWASASGGFLIVSDTLVSIMA